MVQRRDGLEKRWFREKWFREEMLKRRYGSKKRLFRAEIVPRRDGLQV